MHFSYIVLPSGAHLEINSGIKVLFYFAIMRGSCGHAFLGKVFISLNPVPIFETGIFASFAFEERHKIYFWSPSHCQVFGGPDKFGGHLLDSPF